MRQEYSRRGNFAVVLALACTVLAPSIKLHADEIEKVQPVATKQKTIFSIPVGITNEVGASARDLVKFRDPQWSALTFAQIAAGSTDAVTSLNTLRNCATCTEIGVPRFIIGSRPDAHKYIIAGILEIGVEAVTAHHFRNRNPNQKWYWKAFWEFPQMFSLAEHTRASIYNVNQNLR